MSPGNGRRVEILAGQDAVLCLPAAARNLKILLPAFGKAGLEQELFAGDALIVNEKSVFCHRDLPFFCWISAMALATE